MNRKRKKNHGSREINNTQTQKCNSEKQKVKMSIEYQSEGEKVGEKRSDDWWNE